MDHKINTFHPVTVTVELKKKQYLGMNRWVCTIDGGQREVTARIVKWDALNMELAVKSFVPSEVNNVNIKRIIEE